MDAVELQVAGDGTRRNCWTLNRDEMRDLPRKVKLLLTRQPLD